MVKDYTIDFKLAWKYITDETEDVKQELRKLDIIGIDTNKGDLIYATNGKTEIVNGKHKTPTFRYSQNQLLNRYV